MKLPGPFLGLLLVAAVAAGGEREPAPAKPKAGDVERERRAARRKRIAGLVRRLGDADYQRREEASRQLVEIGDDALEALYPARASKDLEVADRAKEVVQQIEKHTLRLEAHSGWAPAGWDNPAGVKTEHDEKAGRRFLVLDLSGEGEHKKSTVSLSLDERGRAAAGRAARLEFRVRHEGTKPLPISAAFLTKPDGEPVYFETSARRVPGKKWCTLSFDLAAGDFKCEATKWAYTSKLKGRAEISRVLVVVDARRKLSLRLTGIRFRKSLAPAPVTEKAKAAAEEKPDKR